jgi:protein-L-isoaspartate(D-aspartate) O-methyltransferase
LIHYYFAAIVFGAPIICVVPPVSRLAFVRVFRPALIMADPIESARRLYAEELCRLNGISSPDLLAAFASVPRERFVGPGPWAIQSSGTSWFTKDADPSHVYRDALIVLDESKHLNNGQPSLWAVHLDLLRVRPGDRILHLGCGTGYYTAILAELTGSAGKVTAIEIEEGLAARARAALEPWPQVTVVQADGSRGPFEPADVIVVSAGATHPMPAWLAAVQPSGKLLFPLTSTRGPGAMAHLIRASSDLFAATLHGSVFFVDFAGARDPAVSSELAQLLRRDEGAAVRSLRCDVHVKDESCWLHGNGWCFSRQAAPMVD